MEAKVFEILFNNFSSSMKTFFFNNEGAQFLIIGNRLEKFLAILSVLSVLGGEIFSALRKVSYLTSKISSTILSKFVEAFSRNSFFSENHCLSADSYSRSTPNARRVSSGAVPP